MPDNRPSRTVIPACSSVSCLRPQSPFGGRRWPTGICFSRGSARLLGVQRPHRGRCSPPHRGLGQLPRDRGGDGLARRHARRDHRRRDDPRRLAALARGLRLPAQQRHHLRALPAGRRHGLQGGGRGNGHHGERRELLPDDLRPLPVLPGAQLPDGRRLRLLRRAGLVCGETEAAATGPALRVRQRDARGRGRLHLPPGRAHRDRPLRHRPGHLPVPVRPAAALRASAPRSWSSGPSSWPASRSGC